MNVKKQEYQKLVSQKAPKSPILKDCLWRIHLRVGAVFARRL